MKKINKSIYGVLIAGLTLSAMTSCIDEAEPRSGSVTQKMLEESASATAAAVNGLPAYGLMEFQLLCVFAMLWQTIM